MFPGGYLAKSSGFVGALPVCNTARSLLVDVRPPVNLKGVPFVLKGRETARYGPDEGIYKS